MEEDRSAQMAKWAKAGHIMPYAFPTNQPSGSASSDPSAQLSSQALQKWPDLPFSVPRSHLAHAQDV